MRVAARVIFRVTKFRLFWRFMIEKYSATRVHAIIRLTIINCQPVSIYLWHMHKETEAKTEWFQLEELPGLFHTFQRKKLDNSVLFSTRPASRNCLRIRTCYLHPLHHQCIQEYQKILAHDSGHPDCKSHRVVNHKVV